MKTVSELKSFIESANPLTEWHQTVFSTFIQLNNIEVEQLENSLILTEPNGKKTTIKN